MPMPYVHTLSAKRSMRVSSNPLIWTQWQPADRRGRTLISDACLGLKESLHDCYPEAE